MPGFWQSVFRPKRSRPGLTGASGIAYILGAMRTPRAGLLVALSCLGLAPLARSQDSHYWTNQYGTRATLLGGRRHRQRPRPLRDLLQSRGHEPHQRTGYLDGHQGAPVPPRDPGRRGEGGRSPQYLQPQPRAIAHRRDIPVPAAPQALVRLFVSLAAGRQAGGLVFPDGAPRYPPRFARLGGLRVPVPDRRKAVRAMVRIDLVLQALGTRRRGRHPVFRAPHPPGHYAGAHRSPGPG